MRNFFITTFIILFLTSACSNKQPESIIDINEAENVPTEEANALKASLEAAGAVVELK